MRIIDTHLGQAVAMVKFLEANGIDPNLIARQPLVYDGRKRRILAEYFHRLDYRSIGPGSQLDLSTIPVWYKIAPNATPRRFGI